MKIYIIPPYFYTCIYLVVVQDIFGGVNREGVVVGFSGITKTIILISGQQRVFVYESHYFRRGFAEMGKYLSNL